MTPQRRQFSYPLDLAKTEEHDLLIARFRQENNLPVLELDEDEVCGQLLAWSHILLE